MKGKQGGAVFSGFSADYQAALVSDEVVQTLRAGVAMAILPLPVFGCRAEFWFSEPIMLFRRFRLCSSCERRRGEAACLGH
jgi:hypothetical protein